MSTALVYDGHWVQLKIVNDIFNAWYEKKIKCLCAQNVEMVAKWKYGWSKSDEPYAKMQMLHILQFMINAIVFKMIKICLN